MTREEKLIIVEQTSIANVNVTANQATYDTLIAPIEDDQVNNIEIKKAGEDIHVVVGVNGQDDVTAVFKGSSVYIGQIMGALKSTVQSLITAKNEEIDNDLTQLEQPTTPTE